MNMDLRIAGIIKESIVDGPGIRLVVFAQGCKHHCPGCHNPETHSFTGGKLVSIASIMEMVKSNPLLDGLSFSGGEPFEQAKMFAELAKMAKALKLSIVTYTGYTYEEIIARKNPGWEELLSQTDLLIDGKYDISRKNLLLRFRGSENQRIIDLNKTMKEKTLVLWD
ncbi:MAG TPA: anaerobic ribonucleoside-triphosphate reductase activating protein [Bacilli bacterium]|nr:anaerobic ribonucleoside-triphosphate reductase activating protein [Bacilli bacterium]HPX84741.1 anaerobic ribonucleoside-triphosphate reductase activating protein [Bacilli bacterium]HQC74746.1 anaerobic ribonucleoside-triphosphate reductase activating protein [Bacilli bacterium]